MAAPLASVEVLYSSDQIADRVRVMAEEITADMGTDVLLIAVLKGSFIFAADLVRALHFAGMRPQVDFLTLSSYGAGTTSSGRIEIRRDTDEALNGRKVLLIDDILESGRTLAFAKNMLIERGAEVRLCVALEKPGLRKAEIEADYVGFLCPDRFVVGYGLDYAHYYRELPFIGTVKDM